MLLTLMLSISIPATIQSFIEQQAHATGFSSPDDYVVHLIQQEQERLEAGQNQVSGYDPIDLMKLPLADRGRILAAQAEAMIEHYREDNEWREFTAGDIIEY
jgi:hypothetical protein